MPLEATEPQPAPFLAPSIRHPKKRAFLAAFASNCNVTRSAELAGVDRTMPPKWSKVDPVFALAFEAARDASIERLELEARRRASLGTLEPVYQLGRCVGYKRVYSDVLLIFLLKGAKPDVYRERTEHTGAGGGPIVTKSVVTFGGRYRPTAPAEG